MVFHKNLSLDLSFIFLKAQSLIFKRLIKAGSKTLKVATIGVSLVLLQNNLQAQCTLGGGTYTLTTNTTCPTFSLSNGATYNINPGVTLTVNGTTTITGGTLNVNGNLNVTSGGLALSTGVAVNFNSPSNSVVSCTPYPGCTAISNLSGVFVASGASLTSNGNVASTNGGTNIIDGTLTINGSFNANGGSTVKGAGTFTSTGSMTVSGGASIFGNTNFNCPSNCNGNNSCTGFAATITTPTMNVCNGSQQTISGSEVVGATYQWETSTTSAFTTVTNLTTTQNYGPFNIGATAFYRRRTTLSGCAEYTNVIKLTVACPTISTSGTIAALSTIYGTPSSTTSFTVSGTNLNEGIQVTAPAGFEVSTSSTTGFASSIVAGTAPTVTSLPIYVRLASTAVPGTYSGNIVLSSLQSTTQSRATASSTVSKKALTITSAAVSNKVYDRTNTATLTGTLSGVVNSDVVTLNLGGTFASINVGTGIAVTSTSSLSGAGAGNYTLTQPTGLTANITPKPLTLTGAAATSKVYNGNTSAVVTGTLSGIIAPDVVTLNGTGTFANSSVGAGKAVTSTSTLAGANSGNYSLTQPAGLTASITAAPLTVQANNVNKVYGNTVTGAAGSTAFTPTGLVNGETIGSVTIAYGTGAAATAAVGSYNTITPSAATGGTFTASNYSIPIRREHLM